jgi:hypothetical protein
MFYLLRAVLCSTLLVLSSTVYSQQSQETPQVKPQQQTESALKQEKNADKSVEKTNNVAPNSPIVVTLPAKVEEKRDTNKTDEEGTEFWPPFLGYRLKITDTLLVLFTAGLFGATYFLWSATKNLVNGAEETAERQLRAYVFFEKGGISDKTQDSATPIFNLVFRNYGQTPTKGAYWIDSAVGAINDERQFPISERRITETFQLAPGAFLSVINFNDEPQQLRLFPEQAKAFSESRIAFFIFGCLEYTDAFGKSRKTSFRFKFTYDSAQQGLLANCNTGNEYT